ncbi:MAG: hypothetical protein OXC63_04250 [Aestuariivita sp.]|nr:hypothetical protein [Aestuariivita sp.]MCY4345741.1 hypothetical protein [Aestuariivita sp.]
MPLKSCKGSATELVVDLGSLMQGAVTYFGGAARDARFNVLRMRMLLRQSRESEI